MTNPFTLIPAKARWVCYVVFSFVLVIHACIALAMTDPDPAWVEKSGDVLQYLGGFLTLAAASNVTRRSRPKPTINNNPLRPDPMNVDGKHEREEGGAVSLYALGAALVIAGVLLAALFAGVLHTLGVVLIVGGVVALVVALGHETTRR